MKAKEQNPIVSVDSIDAYNKLFGLETNHPLVSVLDMRKATKGVNHIRMDYGGYAIYLKNGVNCRLMYGMQPYDYQEGSVVTFRPGQLVGVEMDAITNRTFRIPYADELEYGADNLTQ